MKFDSINGRIAWIITLGVAVSIAVLVFLVSSMTNKAVFEIQTRNMEEINAVMVDEIEQVIKLNLMTLKSLSGSSTVRRALVHESFSASSDMRVRELIKYYDKIQFIGGFNSEGRVMFGENRAGRKQKGLDISSRRYFREIMAGSEFSLSDVSGAKDGSTVVFIIAVPVKDSSGKILGGLVLALDWKAYEHELLGEVAIGKDGYGFILDSKGRIIAHKNDKDLLLKDISQYEFVSDMLSMGSGMLNYDWNGEDKVVAFERIPSTGWIVAMSAYDHDLTSVATSQRNILIAVGVVVIVLLVGILFLFMRRIVINPISMIMDFTSRVAGGDFKAELRGNYSCEFSELAANIETMVGELKNKLGFSEGVLKGISFPSVVADADEKVLFVNQEMLELCGRQGKPESHLGMTVGDLIYGDVNRKTIAGKAIAENRAQHNVEAEIVTARGDEKDVLVNASPLFDLDHKLLGAFIMIADMTEIKRQQKLIEQKNVQISEAAARATEISNQVSEYSSALAAQVSQSSQGAEQQRDMAGETATAMEEMNSTVLEVARNAANAAGTAEESKGKAQDGESIVGKVVETISGVRTQSESLKESMADLGEQAEGIGNIMGVISDIADQTNLLALNAAIEAARAGEAGRGFAVVADEVRKLAEKTMTATNEVGEYINNIQESARRNIDSTERSTVAVNNASELVTQSGSVLSEIVTMVADTTDQVRSIAAASEQQSAASEQISRSTERINTIANENSEAMNESASAVKRMASLAGDLKEVIAHMQD